MRGRGEDAEASILKRVRKSSSLDRALKGTALGRKGNINPAAGSEPSCELMAVFRIFRQ